MNSVIKYDEDLVSAIKSVIFKYCPYREDRSYILGNAQSPEIDIDINFYDNETLIMFLIGNSNFKQSINERLIISSVAEFEKVSQIIDFILPDHEFIKNINLCNDTIDLKFAINWTDKSIKGINCGDIGLNLKFNNNIELKKQYLYMLFQKYYYKLEQTPSFKRIKHQYINSIKQVYLNELDKTQLITLLNDMHESELKELLYNLDDDTFIKYTTENQSQTKVKKLFLEKNNTNN